MNIDDRLEKKTRRSSPTVWHAGAETRFVPCRFVRMFVRLFLLFFADFLRVFVESVVPDGKRRRETRGDRRLGVARGPRDAPRSLYVGLAPTPGKMILFMGSYCFHSCPAQDEGIPPSLFSLSPDGDPGRGGVFGSRGAAKDGPRRKSEGAAPPPRRAPRRARVDH